MSVLEWGSTLFTLLYLYFAVKNKPVCFVFGILASSIWAYVSFHAGLYFDAGLQLFYVIISFLGIYRWMYGGNNNEELPISSLSNRSHSLIIAGGVFLSACLYFLFKSLPNIQMAALDSITTIFLVIGTILLINRNLYSWIYLVVADVVYIYIYGNSGLWLFAGSMVVYVIFGLVGFKEWQKSQINAPAM